MPKLSNDELLAELTDAIIEAKRLGIARSALDSMVRSEARRVVRLHGYNPVTAQDRLTELVNQLYAQ